MTALFRTLMAEGGLKTMFPSMLQVAMACLLAMAVTGGAGLFIGSTLQEPDPPATATARNDEKGRVDRVGDPLPPGAVARLGTVRFRQVYEGGFGAGGLAFLPDGKTLVTAPDGRSIRFWETATGRLLRSISTGEFRINCCALSRDGKRVAVGGSTYPDDGSLPTAALRVSDTATGKEVLSIPRDSREVDSALVFTPDGKHLMSFGNSGVLRVEEVASGKTLLQQKFLGVNGNRLALSVDGTTVAVASSGGKLYLWKWESGEEPRELKAPRYVGHDLAFSPDGKTLAEIGEVDSSLRIWDLADGKVRHKLEFPEGERCSYRFVAFSPDGKTLAAAGERPGWSGVVHLWDPATQHLRRTIDAGGGGGGRLAFSADSTLIAVGNRGCIRVWELASGKEVAGNGEAHQTEVTRLTIAANGLVATASDDHTVRVWDASTGRQRLKLTHDHWVRAVAVSPDGTRLVSSSLDDTVRLWDLQTGREIYRLPGHGSQGGHRVVGFTTDSKRFLSFGDDFYLRVWDVRTGKALLEHKIRPTGIPVPEDDAERDELQMLRLQSTMAQGTFAADGKELVLLAGNKVFFFDVETGKEVRQITAESSSWHPPAVSPDGKLLLVGGSGKPLQIPLPDGRTRHTLAKEHALGLWDLATGKPVRQHTLPGSMTGPVAFSGDGKTYAAAVNDNAEAKIRIWSTATGQEQPEISAIPGQVWSLGFSPDGKHLVSGLRDTTALVWDLTALAVRKP
jgi:WD40 repeat protein